MTLNVLVDMNLAHAWVATLRTAGFNAIHWIAVGSGHALDTEIMQWAVENDHIVFTNDLDFCAILAIERRLKPSVVQMRVKNVRAQSMGSTVVAALRENHDQLLNGCLLTIDHHKQRLRSLPLE